MIEVKSSGIYTEQEEQSFEQEEILGWAQGTMLSELWSKSSNSPTEWIDPTLESYIQYIGIGNCWRRWTFFPFQKFDRLPLEFLYQFSIFNHCNTE